jgi:hypothetical protein
VAWRGDWNAAAKTDDKGWTAELAIPFSILKYPSGQKRFGIILRRNLARIGEETDWPSGTDYYSHENEAFLTDLEAPRQRVVPRYMPYTLMGAGENLKNSAGIDIKYSAPNNITGLLAIRPDFQTIEDDVQTVDFSYNPRYIDDHRPFFTEGGGRFNDGMMFYSRSIGEIDGGLKTFGKVGQLGFGVMDAFRFGGENTALANFSYDTTSRSDVGMSLLNYNGGAGDNRVLKLSANWNKPMKVSGYYWGASAYQSVGGGSAIATSAYIDRWNGWGIPGWHLYYNRIPADYNPSLGFVNEKDKQSVDGWVEYGKEYKTGSLLHWNSELDFRYADHLSGGLFYKGVSPYLSATFRKDWSLGVGYDMNDRPPNQDRVLSFNLGLKIRDLYRSAHLNVRMGHLDGGRYLFASLGKGFKLSDKFSLGLSAERLSLNYPDRRDDLNDTQGVLSGVFDLTPERGIVFRVVGNPQGGNSYVAYRQQLRQGKDAYLIIGDPNAQTFRARVGLKIVDTY